jgi:hypothetical protein
MKYTELTDAMQETASYTAFLYAGAIQSAANWSAMKDRTNLFDDWDGHRGFVRACAEYAHAIRNALDARADEEDAWPGVMEYEILEPLGEWLLTEHEYPPAVPIVTVEFMTRFLAWVKKYE